ncbi:MAG: hypothetical protein K0Q79_822 [Flavipsychrobacter sp.]|jgi:hypothetical protein|nr:hypothetical protein [Flavipsychrobacter sp.]
MNRKYQLLPFIILVFTGCKKDYTCTCGTGTYNPYTQRYSSGKSVTTIYGTENKGRKKCEDIRNSLNKGHNITAECEFK